MANAKPKVKIDALGITCELIGINNHDVIVKDESGKTFIISADYVKPITKAAKEMMNA